MKLAEGFTFSRHALARALDMQVDPRQLRLTLTSPELVEQASDHPGRRYFKRDKLSLLVAADGTVVTVMWRDDKGWKKDFRRGSYGGRELREGNVSV
ncbi:DUF4258 domain-containing protein [Mycobacteroides abscessus]|uniref:DUF4258 domain-containing protein n=1 Tax=Mycobacteroides abscessus TaxID=36809 RepID=UPI0009C5B1AF|nr:DUF4258 domain-containing protein [Mycobacteroides abscessus]UVK63430.1 BrnT-like toxin [Mycobacterium phage Baudelaire]WKW86545.1 BrnT-like toxin [Mycobacterium phage Aegeus]SKT46678.1 Uncharacterised protein [Mycobacteroides abscessus subsp. bolletii]